MAKTLFFQSGVEISHHTESAKCRLLQYSLLLGIRLLHVIAVNSQLQCLHRLSIRVNCKESFVWADAIYGLDAGLAWSGPEAHAQYFTRPAARILHCLDLLGRALKLTGRKCTNGQLGRLHKLQYIKPMTIVQHCVLLYPRQSKAGAVQTRESSPHKKVKS